MTSNQTATVKQFVLGAICTKQSIFAIKLIQNCNKSPANASLARLDFKGKLDVHFTPEPQLGLIVCLQLLPSIYIRLLIFLLLTRFQQLELLLIQFNFTSQVLSKVRLFFSFFSSSGYMTVMNFSFLSVVNKYTDNYKSKFFRDFVKEYRTRNSIFLSPEASFTPVTFAKSIQV